VSKSTAWCLDINYGDKKMNALGKQNKNQRDCLKQLGAVGISGYALSSLTMAQLVGGIALLAESPQYPVVNYVIKVLTNSE
jgi:hypothetical protein